MRIADLALRLLGATSGELILKAPATASGTVTFPTGTTDFSGTGGAGQVVKQTAAGGAFTVAQVAAATDLSGQVPVANGGTNATTAAAALTNLGAAPIVGTNTNNNAPAGQVGEYISAFVTSPGTSVANNAVVNVTSISLTAGDWDVEGNIGATPAGTTTISSFGGTISLVSAAYDADSQGSFQVSFANAAGTKLFMPTGKRRISIAATSTVYLVCHVTFAVSTCTVFGFIAARRMR